MITLASSNRHLHHLTDVCTPTFLWRITSLSCHPCGTSRKNSLPCYSSGQSLLSVKSLSPYKRISIRKTNLSILFEESCSSRYCPSIADLIGLCVAVERLHWRPSSFPNHEPNPTLFFVILKRINLFFTFHLLYTYAFQAYRIFIVRSLVLSVLFSCLFSMKSIHTSL